MKNILIFISVFSILLVGVVYFICFNGTKEVSYEFSDEIMNKLEQEFQKVPNNAEFVANLHVENGVVKDYSFIGYKVLPTFTTTGHIIYNDEDLKNVKDSNITIHSHPGGNMPWSCWISPIDKLSLEDVECIYCNKEVKCYEK